MGELEVFAMGLLKTVLWGRDNGIRAGIRRSILGQSNSQENPEPTFSPSAQDGGVLAGGSNKLEPPRDVTPPNGYEVVLHVDALKPGEVTEVIIGGTAIAIANVDGNYHALNNSCPHAGGPLGEGSLSGSMLRCPYHDWGFDVTDGSCQTNPEISVPIYPVVVEKTAVCVQL